MTRKEFRVDHGKSGQRIDIFLAEAIPELSRRKIRRILDVGGCYINNKRTHIASRLVRLGDTVRVEFSLESLKKHQTAVFQFQDSDIIFDDKGVIAINKPPGLPSQATKDQDVMHAEVCLAKWLKAKGRANEKLILVHRLDKETSGVLLFATNSSLATHLTDQFRSRKVNKTYWALCLGVPELDKFEKDCFLSEIDKKSGRVRVVSKGGKSSYTHFEVNRRLKSEGLSWIHCFPKTGRSHQIRVHLEALGFPILGDKKYGEMKNHRISEQIFQLALKHHMLHARSIEFLFPNDQNLTKIDAIPPEHFSQILSLFTDS